MIPAALAVPAGAALVQGIGSFLGGRSQSRAAERAADAQTEAQQRALDFQKQIYGESAQRLDPYLQAGQQGLQQFQSEIAGFNQPTLNYTQSDFNLANWKDPGYDFRLAEAQKAIDASTAAKGMTLGSGALKSLQTRGQDMASQEYQNAFDRWQKESAMRYGQASDQYGRDYAFGQNKIANLGNLANVGLNAAWTLGNLGSGFSGSMSNLMTAQGDARANAALAQGGANAAGWSNLGAGLGDFITNAGQYYSSNPSIKQYTK